MDIDVVFIIPNNSNKIYQNLSIAYSAIETPTWALLLAESCRSKGFNVKIIDTTAENLSDDDTYQRLKDFSPRLINFVVYGQNVNSGTTNMSGATRLSKYLKLKNKNFLISFTGSHIQALPIETLNKEQSIDIGFTNEGVYALHNVLRTNLKISELKKVKGIVFRDNNKITINDPEIIVPQENMDKDLPGYAWDLLPYKEKPFDLYRSPLWHAEYNEKFRSP